jgi:hypothetical protein
MWNLQLSNVYKSSEGIYKMPYGRNDRGTVMNKKLAKKAKIALT